MTREPESKNCAMAGGYFRDWHWSFCILALFLWVENRYYTGILIFWLWSFIVPPYQEQKVRYYLIFVLFSDLTGEAVFLRTLYVCEFTEKSWKNQISDRVAFYQAWNRREYGCRPLPLWWSCPRPALWGFLSSQQLPGWCQKVTI